MKLEADLFAYPWKSLQENNCNSYLIWGESPILIDPGHQHLVKNLIKQMEQEEIRWEDLRVILATHFHPDHFEGTQMFARGGVFIALSEEEEKFMQEILRDLNGSSISEKIKVDFYLQEGELIIGDKTLQVISTPGHTPGSISLYWPERKALFTGDAVFYMGIGRTDLVGGDGVLLRESIERLAQLDAEWLLPGHGEIIKGRYNIQRNFAYIRANFYEYL